MTLKNAKTLLAANKELAFQNEEKERRAAELAIANKELAFQNKEKEKRAAELVLANKELVFHNKEKEKRAAELTIANKKLLFENLEKGKRAAELIIANKELAFQNKEKGKRARELSAANKKLAFENKEKEKRAAELVIANAELAFQNREKSDRAGELALANEELAFQNRERAKRADELCQANSELKDAENEIKKINGELEERVKKRTQELTAANTALEAFSYSVSHDLRSPVRSVMGFVKIINNEYAKSLSPDVKDLFAHIETGSRRMNSIIDSLLILAKYGKEKLRLEKVDLNLLFQSVWDHILFVEPHAAALKMETLPTVSADAGMLQQVVINLLSNAVKYSSKTENPCVEVGCTINPTHVVIHVKDNGAGFDMKYYDKLFMAFQRLHGMNEFEGTGVGLMLVKRIIDRHSGTVWAEGKVNEGATFYFSLPVLHKKK